MTSGDPIVLGPFPVEATRAEVEAFRAATGLARTGDTLPLTFPMRWMASPVVRDALLSLVGEPDMVPVHEGQSFDYATPLRLGLPYSLTLRARRETAPDRLIAEGSIVAADGKVHATLETILRLFSMAAVAA